MVLLIIEKMVLLRIVQLKVIMITLRLFNDIYILLQVYLTIRMAKLAFSNFFGLQLHTT